MKIILGVGGGGGEDHPTKRSGTLLSYLPIMSEGEKEKVW